MTYAQYCLGILPISYVFHLRRSCPLFKQSTHITFVHNTFYDVFGFYEFNKLCSAYSVYKHSHGHFKACVWHAFYRVGQKSKHFVHIFAKY